MITINPTVLRSEVRDTPPGGRIHPETFPDVNTATKNKTWLQISLMFLMFLIQKNPRRSDAGRLDLWLSDEGSAHGCGLDGPDG